jgi:hypothetical protein
MTGMVIGMAAGGAIAAPPPLPPAGLALLLPLAVVSMVLPMVVSNSFWGSTGVAGRDEEEGD